MNDTTRHPDASSTALTATTHAAVAEPRRQSNDLTPRNFEEAMRLAEMLSQSDLVPKDYRGKPANCLIAMQWGMEVGLKPLQALQGIAVINGRPSLWGDALIAVVRASPACEWIVETMDAAGTAFCQVKRRGETEQVRSFSQSDADKAGLTSKDGPWKTAPKRMRQMRARAFALRDVFPDVLKGMAVAEEVIDIEPETAPKPAADLRAAGESEIVLPDAIRKGAEDSSAEGLESYGKWFSSSTVVDRQMLGAARHAIYKAKAEAVDRARVPATGETVATPEGDKGGPISAEHADFVADMDKAAERHDHPAE